MNVTELFDLSGKVAVITGGAGDIGTVYGRALCEAGASVVLADLDEAAAAKVADGLTAGGGNAVGVAVNVVDAESTRAMASAAVDAIGGIDILVNNAAIMTDLPRYGLSNIPVEEWNRVIDVNSEGPLLCTQAVLPSMTRPRRRAHHQRPFGRGVHGRRHLRRLEVRAARPHRESRERARTARHQRQRDRARPRRFQSGYLSLAKDSPMRAALESGIPGKKSGPPEDLVGTLLLLCSSAGAWINGQSISVDGGWVMRL